MIHQQLLASLFIDSNRMKGYIGVFQCYFHIVINVPVTIINKYRNI